MKNKRYGFTLIEVSIFLVITGALFAAIAVGVQNSIYQQRQNDALQSLLEYLRGIYSQVTNVESEGGGDSEYAIYGKLLTFGQSTNLAGEPNDKNALFSYNVVGRIGETDNSNILQSLKLLDANVIMQNANGSRYQVLGLADSYTPRWAAAIQDTNNYDLYKGAVLVVRHPRSGTVYTYVMNGQTVEVNETIKTANMGPEITSGINPLLPFINDDYFSISQLDLCLNMDGNVENSLRFDIRILKNARNASGIQTVSDDDNKCRIGD